MDICGNDGVSVTVICSVRDYIIDACKDRVIELDCVFVRMKIGDNVVTEVGFEGEGIGARAAEENGVTWIWVCGQLESAGDRPNYSIAIQILVEIGFDRFQCRVGS